MIFVILKQSEATRESSKQEREYQLVEVGEEWEEMPNSNTDIFFLQILPEQRLRP